MKAFKDILRIKERTDNVILFEVEQNSQLDLIMHGFNGDEKLFRILNHNGQFSYTAFCGDDLKPTSTLEWGNRSCTCATESWKAEKDKVVDAAKELNIWFNK